VSDIINISVGLRGISDCLNSSDIQIKLTRYAQPESHMIQTWSAPRTG